MGAAQPFPGLPSSRQKSPLLSETQTPHEIKNCQKARKRINNIAPEFSLKRQWGQHTAALCPWPSAQVPSRVHPTAVAPVCQALCGAGDPEGSMVRLPPMLRATLEAEELPGPGPEAGEEGQTKGKGRNSRRDERAQAQRSRVTCPGSPSQWGSWDSGTGGWPRPHSTPLSQSVGTCSASRKADTHS